ncbi:MAG: bifunctional folylpolyglutamate synthase/dihydrofolate synthase [Candidatus Thermoplasmatota archaeon]|nr:bifunctional folylpolyglutamate synthase/dihydrofolate synthase [Candidatus Thermoplasmatota archaeon]
MEKEPDEKAARKINEPKDEFDHPEDYFYSLKRVGVKLGLDKIEDFLSRINDPHLDFESILVGGTNGKGSVCRTLVNILKDSGYRTGLYVSPHLTHFEERIQVDGEKIEKEELWSIIEEVHPVIREIEEEEPEKRPSFFEALTAVAFKYFSKKDIDIAVLEVGMGGRLDATNVAPHDFSATTYVGRDHAEYLGDTKKEIAYEKAGIIKEGNYFVTGEKDPSIRKYLEGVCEERSADFNHAYDRDYEISYDPLILEVSPYGELDIQGEAPWQAENVLLALKIAEGLQEKGYEIDQEDIISGIEKSTFPGKMETIRTEPWIMMDSAHNESGFKALKEGMERLDYDHLRLVVGMLEDKDYGSLSEVLGPVSDKVYTAEPVSERKLDSDKLAETFDRFCPSESFEHGVKALEKAEEDWRDGDLILITGSMYLLGDIRRKMS